MLRIVKDLVDRSLSRTNSPAYITMTRSHSPATTPRSWVISTIDMPSSRCRSLHELEDLRLHGDVERRGRLVGDQEIGLAQQRHRDHHALAHAARKLVRILSHAPLGVGNAHQLEHLRARALAPSRSLMLLVRDQRPR